MRKQKKPQEAYFNIFNFMKQSQVSWIFMNRAHSRAEVEIYLGKDFEVEYGMEE